MLANRLDRQIEKAPRQALPLLLLKPCMHQLAFMLGAEPVAFTPSTLGNRLQTFPQIPPILPFTNDYAVRPVDPSSRCMTHHAAPRSETKRSDKGMYDIC